MDDDQQFCLRWNNHQSTLISVFDTLLENGTLVDCTLAAEGKFLKAHKVVLSACSPYFATLLSEQYDKHPIFILKDVKYQELRAMMDYMYRGEVNISQDQLAALLKAAESLQIKGLSDNRAGSSGGQKPTAAEHKNLSVPGKMSGAGGGYTLEQTKRARLGPSSVESQELSGSREGSSSPTSRKRRKVRRRSVENVMADNHDNSNSSQSMQINSSAGTLSNATGAITSVATIVTTGVPSSSIPITTSGSASTIAANVTKKTESVSKLVNTDVISTDNEQDDEINEKIIHHGQVRKEQNHHKRASKLIASGNMGDVCKDGSEIAIEPKSEYDDGNDETVEDLTLDDEDIGLEDLDQTAGPSHGGEGSSQGYAQWQVDRSHDEVYMATQEAQQRDPQAAAEDLSITRIAGLTWSEWNARLAMPLVTQLREGAHPLIFPTDLSRHAMEKLNLNPSISTTTPTTSLSDRKSPILFSSSNVSSCMSNVVTSTPTGSVAAAAAAVVAAAAAAAAAVAAGNGGVGATSCSSSSAGVAANLINNLSSSCSVANNSNINANTRSNANSDAAVINIAKFENSSIDDYDTENSQSAGCFSDSKSSLCNISLLNAMSYISGNGSGSGGSGHPCPDCGRVYKLKSSLRNHQKWECGKEPQFKCPFCVYRAKQKMHIGRHMERMHKEKFLKLGDKVFAAAAEEAAAQLSQHF